MQALYLITARKGSKGIPNKNIKKMCGMPLIQFSINLAKQLTSVENICLSTDSEEIAKVALNAGLKIPFLRPANISVDNASSYDVIKHAYNFYIKKKKTFDVIVLLQPTSPLRKAEHIKKAMSIYNTGLDMVMSVKVSKANPCYTLYNEDKYGFLNLLNSKKDISRRQDVPDCFEANGAIYIINTRSLMKYKSFYYFKKVKKYVMDNIYSVDIDDNSDWKYCEFLLKNKYVVLT